MAEIREKIAELEDNGTELKDYTWLSQVPAACILFTTANCICLFVSCSALGGSSLPTRSTAVYCPVGVSSLAGISISCFPIVWDCVGTTVCLLLCLSCRPNNKASG